MQAIALSGADNTRDLGGTAVRGGRKVKRGMFIRSNHLNMLTAEDTACLSGVWHLRRIIDLRTDMEVEEKPDREVPGCVWLHMPLFKESALGITHEKAADFTALMNAIPDMESLYRHIVTDEFSVSQLRLVLEEIMRAEDGAVLWHCTEGKDRCGIVSALTLELLGADRKTIFDDYLTTNLAAGKRADSYSALVLQKTGDETAAETVRKVFLADTTYLQAAYDAIEEKWDSIDQFFKEEMGIDRGRRKQFQGRCLI